MRLKQLVQMSEMELAALDVGVIHHICAQGLPGANDICLESASRTLDEMARKVGQRTSEYEWMFRRNPKQFQRSRAFFQAVVLTTTIQRDFGVRTAPKLNHYNNNEGWSDSRNVFLHGFGLA